MSNVFSVKHLKRTGGEFARYFFVSLVALLCDFFVLITLSEYLHYILSAIIGFLFGAIVHYVLSIFFVFNNRKLKTRKLIESVLFVATGVAGLLVNVAVIGLCVELLSLSIVFAKIVAAGFSFLFGYVSRKIILF